MKFRRLRVKCDQPTAAEKRWRETVREMGSVLSGLKPCEVHHCAGRTARHNKIDIGHWFVIPLTTYEHSRIAEWGRSRKDYEKALFRAMCRIYTKRGGVLPFGADVLEAIADYHK